MAASEKRPIPKWQWDKKFECVVEVINSGHFPDTATVRLPDGKITTTYLKNLEVQHGSKL